METYLTVKDVALLLQLSVQTIRRYTMNREIPFHKINRAVRYKPSEIEKWVEERKALLPGKGDANIQAGLFAGGGTAQTAGEEITKAALNDGL